MTASILMPFAENGDPYRLRNAQFVAAYYGARHPGLDFHVHDGWQSEHGWSKGAAVNGAARHARGDVFVIADADSIVPVDALETAIDLVERGDFAWVVPFGRVWRLDNLSTIAFIADDENIRRRTLDRKPYRAPVGGGVLVVSRQAFMDVHGMDGRFVGWGGEDISFGYTLSVLWGRHFRLEGELIHLWHPPATPDLRGNAESEMLVKRYQHARGDPVALRALVEERPPVIDDGALYDPPHA